MGHNDGLKGHTKISTLWGTPVYRRRPLLVYSRGDLQCLVWLAPVSTYMLLLAYDMGLSITHDSDRRLYPVKFR